MSAVAATDVRACARAELDPWMRRPSSELAASRVLGLRDGDGSLQTGRGAGLGPFRLDVAAEKQTAIRMYQAADVEVTNESADDGPGIRYLAMERHEV